MDQQKIFLTILGMSAVTYLPRLLPAWLLSSYTLPKTMVIWLRFVPPAVMAAMLVPWLVISDGAISLHPGNLFLMAAVPTLFLAMKTRSFFGTVLTGMAFVAAGRYLSGL